MSIDPTRLVPLRAGAAARPARAPAAASALAVFLAALGSSGCFVIDRPLVGVDRVGPERVDQELNEQRPDRSAAEREHARGPALLRPQSSASRKSPRRPWSSCTARSSPTRSGASCTPSPSSATCAARSSGAASTTWPRRSTPTSTSLGEDELEPANPYDRRFRWACDLYNRGLRAGLRRIPRARDAARGRAARAAGRQPRRDASIAPAFPFDDPAYRFLPADDYSVWGLSVRLRDSGLGAPLVAGSRASATSDPLRALPARELHAPATIFLRVHGGLARPRARASGRRSSCIRPSSPRRSTSAGKRRAARVRLQRGARAGA